MIPTARVAAGARRGPLLSRALVAGVVVLAAAVALAAPASAHALAVSSTPAAGADLARPPKQVVVTFGEMPDPKLSHLRVLDGSGHDHAVGPTTAVSGHPVELEVNVGPLTDGVYTVAWTTVSSVDGHLAGGSFAFGIGAQPSSAATTSTATAQSPPLSATVGRWLLYAGLMTLVGAAVVGLSCFDPPPAASWPWLICGGAILAAVGAIAIALGEASLAGVGLGSIVGSTFGTALLRRLAPLVVGAVIIAVFARHRPRRRLAIAGLAGAVGMFVDVTFSHADAAVQDEALKVVEQWCHFLAAGVWLGGLLTLIVGLRALDGDRRRRAAARFSAIALASVVVLVATGTLRAIDEVGTWHALVSTTFGQAILVKVGLLVVLVALGAYNRYRSVPAVGESGRSLLTIGRVELALAAVVLVATAVLQGQAPPSETAAAAGPPPIVVEGHDFATTVKVRLTVAPGTTGFNQYTALVTDYDSGRPVRADVSLVFSLPAQPDLGRTTLALRRATDGSYQGSGAQLSVTGTWAVAATIQRASSAVEVDLEVTPRSPPERITVQRSPGIPDLYTASLPDGSSLQVYVDPGRPGFDEVHATYVGTDGKEVPMQSVTISATGPGKAHTQLTVRRLDSLGHFVADLPGAGTGTYRYQLEGRPRSGAPSSATVSIPIR
jgi:putative copper export protein/methionine-rich copper-binding protein CopC